MQDKYSDAGPWPDDDELPFLNEPDEAVSASGVDAPAMTGSERGAEARRLPTLVAAIVCLALVAAAIVLGVLLYNRPEAAARLRDIFIIILGIQSLILGLLLIAVLVALVYLALKLYGLVRFAEDEVRPMLQRIDDLVRHIHSRSVFVSDVAVKPVLEIVGVAAAAKSILRSFRLR